MLRGLVVFVPFFIILPYALVNPFFAAMLWQWVSLGNPHRIVYGFFSTLPYAMIVAICTFISLVLSGEIKKFRLDRFTRVLLVFALWMTLTAWFALGPATDVWPRWLEIMKILLFTIITYFLIDTRQRLYILIWVTTLSIGFYALRGFVFVLMSGGGGRVYGPEGSSIADNNDLGVAFVTVLPFVAFFWKQAEARWQRLGMGALTGMMFISTLFTYSRGAFLAISVLGVAFWLRSSEKFATGVLIVVLAGGVWFFAPAALFDRFRTIETYQEDGSATGRLNYWGIAIDIALQRPLVGGGYRYMMHPEIVNRMIAESGLPRLTRPRTAHSIWFEQLGEQGFVGFAIFITILVIGWLNAGWLIRTGLGNQNSDWAVALGRMCQVSMVAYMTGGSFASLSLYDGFYTTLIIGAAARWLLEREVASQSDPASLRFVARPSAVPVGKGAVGTDA